MKKKKDWCTMFPEKWFHHRIGGCCQTHDFQYEEVNGYTRLQADNNFFKCIKKKSHFYLGALLWLAVRTFGYFNYVKKGK